ncbi:tumor protein p53-inducible protein 13 [Alosa sapidissima]|uniref:tumor protein p53-inducible protein 13 n=1 Tax=Alosa sapidissima TaxID=34773 RepID=UPI001C095A5F|nr:tumor protein p53-inducible protein 13 [Alosa sapidissima]
MTPQVIILLTGLCWTCCQSALAWQLCDNGKFQLERDLPRSLLYCSEPYFEDSNQKQHVVQKSPPPLQPAKHVCMDTAIIYNATIPNRGDHRPVGAQPGVYLYCPPQRWLNNLQHGSIVALHHPCAPERQRARVTALVQSCLPGYIVTTHPWLSTHRPVALVSWGRTLEMSHVTAPEVCDWLVSVSSNRPQQHSDPERSRRVRYSLLLTHAAPLHREKDTAQDTHETTSQIDWLKNLKSCCEQTLSHHKDGVIRREDKDGRIQKRERRAALPAREEYHPEESHAQLNNETDLHGTLPSKLNDTFTHATVETKRTAAAAVPVQSTARPRTAAANVSPPAETKVGAGEPKKAEAPGTQEQEGHSQTGGEGGGGGWEQGKVTSAENTRSRTHYSHTLSHGQTHRKAGAGRGSSGDSSPRQRVREDTEEQQRLKERETEAPAVGVGVAGRGSVAGDRRPMARTDDAVWAAAALGFLLVLLTLSVLHTRLYRHWRTMPSLYWHDRTQDYDSVADVVRRRLKLAGRRKRRVGAGRRQEAPLITISSTEEDSD